MNRAATRGVSPLAGKPAPASILVDPGRLEAAYYERTPDPDDPAQLVSFGTSGHRGSSLRGSFTEAHIPAITQAICDYRRGQRHRRPALHGQGHARAVAAGAAHGARSARGQRRRDLIQRDDGVTPTPVISRAILTHNRGRDDAPGRRHRHHAVAQSAGGRRLQIQPAQRRPRRHRRHGAGAGARQRPAARPDSTASSAFRSARRWRGRPRTSDDFVLPYVAGSAERRRHGRDPRRRPHASASIRSAARRRRTGSRSTRSTDPTSPSSIPRSIRRSRS